MHIERKVQSHDSGLWQGTMTACALLTRCRNSNSQWILGILEEY